MDRVFGIGVNAAAARRRRPLSGVRQQKKDEPQCIGLDRGYALVRCIGTGSFGTACLMKDEEGKFCVMKTVNISNMPHKDQEEAVNEVKVLASLKHPYIVRYRESFLEAGYLGIVMDYAEGGDLQRRVQQARQGFPEQQILKWITQATLGLKYLHTQHVLHRDMKTANLFLTKQDRVQIGDFGISTRHVSEKSQPLQEDRLAGTPYYLSPEICREGLYSHAGDMWALGCILHELATLKVPFEAQEFARLVEKISNAPVPELPMPPYSPDLRALFRDLLRRDHVRRPSSSEVLQRPIIQGEISRMLKSENGQENVPPTLQRTAASTMALGEQTMSAANLKIQQQQQQQPQLFAVPLQHMAPRDPRGGAGGGGALRQPSPDLRLGGALLRQPSPHLVRGLRQGIGDGMRQGPTPRPSRLDDEPEEILGAANHRNPSPMTGGRQSIVRPPRPQPPCPFSQAAPPMPPGVSPALWRAHTPDIVATRGQEVAHLQGRPRPGSAAGSVSPAGGGSQQPPQRQRSARGHLLNWGTAALLTGKPLNAQCFERAHSRDSVAPSNSPRRCPSAHEGCFPRAAFRERSTSRPRSVYG
eukprot:TRINITY_DN20035_c0_g1_i1.p1 TRINITY_DN20035_c0_g1~~TRINITY_DN20035_c0_g1_i1.p1  ORF type:complete len:586 (+),score=97.97 TRINITY_DN20035_c0_g1_i1:123-1880(+)